MGTILAIVAYELHTTTVQGHQDGVKSSPEDESNTPEINADLILWTCPVGSLIKMEPEKETNFGSTSPNEFEGLEDYSVRLLDGVKITLEEESKLETMTETQTSESSLNKKYYLNYLHSSPHQRLFSPPRVKPYFKQIQNHQLYKNECKESAHIPCECVDYHASFFGMQIL